MALRNIAVFFILLASCTPKSYVFDGKKLQQVVVSDMGDLFSSYKFSETDKKELSSKLQNKSLVEQILTYSKEENWPDAVNTLEKRLKSRNTMLQYHFYKVAVIGNKTVLSVPSERNRHMPYGFVPAGVMYVVFKSSSVTVK